MNVNQPGTPTVWRDFLGSKTGEGSNPLSTGKSLYAWDAPKTHHEVWILMLKPWLVKNHSWKNSAKLLGFLGFCIYLQNLYFWNLKMDVSKNNGIPKSSHFNRDFFPLFSPSILVTSKWMEKMMDFSPRLVAPISQWLRLTGSFSRLIAVQVGSWSACALTS